MYTYTMFPYGPNNGNLHRVMHTTHTPTESVTGGPCAQEVFSNVSKRVSPLWFARFCLPKGFQNIPQHSFLQFPI